MEGSKPGKGTSPLVWWYLGRYGCSKGVTRASVAFGTIFLLVTLLSSFTSSAWASYLDTPVFPGASLVDSTPQDETKELVPVQVVLSPVEKIGRNLRIEYALNLSAMRNQQTYLLPKSSTVDEAIEHYGMKLEGTRLFRCRGRDCGRSNLWANDLFDRAVLYGPNIHQRYLVVQQDAELLSVYVAQRGNRRVYVHLDHVRSSQLPGALGGQNTSTQLLKLGTSLLGGVTPDSAGKLSAFARERLIDIGGELGSIASARIYVVCHLNDGQSGELLLQAAQSCADTASEQLKQGYSTKKGAATLPEQSNRARSQLVEFVPFAAGPLLPRNDAPGNRIELVIPERLWRDNP